MAEGSGITLVVKEAFEAFGTAYNKGQSFDVSEAKNWPKGTLQRRIQNGFLGYDEEDLLGETEQLEDPDAAAVAAISGKQGKSGRSFQLPAKPTDGKPAE